MAIATSAFVPCWKRPTTSRVSAGFRLSKVSPEVESHHSPAMKWRKVGRLDGRSRSCPRVYDPRSRPGPPPVIGTSPFQRSEALPLHGVERRAPSWSSSPSTARRIEQPRSHQLSHCVGQDRRPIGRPFELDAAAELRSRERERSVRSRRPRGRRSACVGRSPSGTCSMAMRVPSGDQRGKFTPRPASWRTTTSAPPSIDRTMWTSLSGDMPNATRRPSGDGVIHWNAVLPAAECRDPRGRGSVQADRGTGPSCCRADP